MLAKAKQNRQITIEEAQAKLESAKFDSQAEVERARGVAEANRIIGRLAQGQRRVLTVPLDKRATRWQLRGHIYRYRSRVAHLGSRQTRSAYQGFAIDL